MAVNRFSTPVDSQYISQYVPIPFQELYAIGKEYNTQRQQAEKQLSDYVQKWSEFESPSAVDTQRWYDITMRPAIKVAEQYARNPELLKTPEGRSSIYNLINNLPYDKLNALKSSRDNMLKRLEMNMRLAAEGKYNPLWHDVDFTNYDTLSSSGIFNDLSPLAYKSEVDLVKPYVDNLKDSYLYSQGGYDYFGVSPDDIDAQVHDNISAIYNTPEAQMHIKALMKQGLSEKDAKDTFERSIYLAGRKFARVNREANAFSLLREKENAKNPQIQPKDLLYFTNEIEITGLKNFLASKENQLTNTKEYIDIVNNLGSSDPKVKKQALQQAKNLYIKSDSRKLFRSIFDEYGTVDATGKTKLNPTQLKNGVNDILNRYSINVNGGKNQELLQTTIPNLSPEAVDTPLGKRKIISGAENMNLMSRVIAGVAGFEPTQSRRSKVLQSIKSGALNNIILLSSNRIVSVPGLNTLEVKVAISDVDAKRLGLTDNDLKDADATEIIVPGKNSKSQTVTKTGSYDQDEDESSFDKTSSSTNVSSTSDSKYWQLTLSNEIPMSGLGARQLNQEALKNNIRSIEYTKEFPSVQSDAYNND